MSAKITSMLKPTSEINFSSVNKLNKILTDPNKLEPGRASNLREPFYSLDIKQLNLLEFCRMYKLICIPVIDFIFIYILLYVINYFYLDYDMDMILIATIPITLLFEIIICKNLKISIYTVAIIMVSIFYLVYTYKF